ncbi:MAG: tetratricopeptide repeat protein [Bacteroidales bacterium]|nr:tetratricopeptide repeat protein [Bacteroidales bacterium]
MNKKLFNVSLALATAIILFATSCSSSLKPLSQSNFKVTPSPLETVGMEVPVTVNGTFPEKWFHPNATVTITPVLKYAGNKELKATPYTYQGEKAAGNGITISKKRGGNFVMNFKFPYQKGMEVAELFMRFDAQIKNKKANLPDVKVADGVITTSVLADALTTDPSFSDDNFQRIIKEKQEEAIMFLIESAELRQSELTKEGLQAWKKRVEEAFSDPKQQIALEIGGYASPDGPLTLNETLAQQRLKNSLNYLDKEFKKKNISTDINTHYTEEDWEGFKQLVEASDLQDKELIIRILSMYTDPEEREQQIKNLSHIYQELAETVLPELRRARLIASINIIGKTDDEIMSFWRNDPKKLNIEELLYATTLTDNDAEKERIYQYITVNFPQDYRGWNNLGALFYKQGNINKAEQSFNRAAQISPNAPEVNMNLALIAMINNDLDKAEELLGKAGGAKNLNAALGLLYLKKGEYNKATEAFGNLKSNNAALAQLLVKDYSKASQTLAAIPNPDATTAYLAAIVAARTNNFNDVLTNLQTAIQRDKSMAQKAANDLEFAKYRTNSEFVSLIQ